MTTTEAPEEQQQVEEPHRLLPRVSLAIAILTVLSVVGTLLLGWLGTLPEHPVFEVGREVFGNIPAAIIALFYIGVAAFIGVSGYLFVLRARDWERGAGERRSGMLKKRVHQLREGLSMRTVFEDRRAGAMHAMIYYGFIVLFLGTVTLEIDHLLPADYKFLHGVVYQGYSFVLDVFALVFLAGLVSAAAIRYGLRPLRLRTKTRPEDAWILLTLALIGVTGLAVEAARISLEARPDFEMWSFAGYTLSFAIPASAAQTIHRIFWVSHAALFVGFLVLLPTTKLRHMFTSPLNMGLAPHDRHKGAMRAVPNLLQATDVESIGASVVGEFTWKQLLDTDACTVCGRCTSVCPANTTGKSLDPREIVLKLGEVAARSAPDAVSPPVAVDAEITVTSDLVFERITAEELWACTTCRACDQICPVNIEIVDKILDMRRYLSLMEADFPTELGKAYVSLENSSNAYGLAQGSRADWATSLDFPVKMLGEPGVTAEYLYWVGCAGSFDDRNRKVTIATARLLNEAGVDFAILGPRELCTGDPARRTGNEYVFQGLALQNIETLNDLGVTKVITQCPHCFNTLANEYPQFGGEYQVVHHSELLAQLVANGKLTPRGNGERITFHDPCYLGRYNDVFIAPRDVVDALGERQEMPRNGTRAFCCGAGGGKFWYEEHTGKKVNIERTEEALATGADIVATACPFCYVMLDDGVKELGQDSRIEVMDLAMLLADRALEE